MVRALLFQVGLLALVPQVAWAEEPRSITVAMIVPRAQEAMLSGAIEALRSQLVDLPVDLRVEPVSELGFGLPSQIAMAREVARRSQAAIVFWCDLETPVQVVFYFAEPEEGQLVVRNVEGAEATAMLDTLALIVRGSVRAALQSEAPADAAPETAPVTPVETGSAAEASEVTPETAGEAEYEVPPPGPAPAPVEPEETRGVLDLDLAYGFQIYSDEDPATHALGLTIAVGLAENWAVFVDYRHVFTEITARHKQVRTRLQRYPMSLGVRFRWPLAEFEVGADLAATLNYVALETSAPGLDVNPDQRDLVFSVSPLLRASYCVVSRLRVFLSAGAEIFVNRRTYGVAGSTGREVLLDPWPVRPRLLAGVTADLF